MKILTKYILFFIGFIFLSISTSYAKKTIITVEKDLRKIQITNHKGYMVKTYYEKFSIRLSSWLRAACKKEELKSKNSFKIILNCKFTPKSLRLISDNENNNEIKKVASKSSNKKNQQDQSQEQDQSQDQDQSQEQDQSQDQDQSQEQIEEKNLPLDPPLEGCNDHTVC